MASQASTGRARARGQGFASHSQNAAVAARKRTGPEAGQRSLHEAYRHGTRDRGPAGGAGIGLGDEAPALIKQVTGMQDLLGELQDAHVAEALLDGFLRDHRKAARKRPAEISLAGVEAYREFQLARQAELVAAFPAPWADVVGPDFRRKLALAVAAM